MPRHKEAQNLFFIGQPLALFPIGHLWQVVAALASGLGPLIEEPEEPGLPLRRVFLGLLRPLHRLVHGGHQRSAPAQRVQRPGLDQRLDHPLVHHPQIDLFAELPQAHEPPARLRPRLHDRLDRVSTHVLHRRQSKPDRLSLRRNMRRKLRP